MPKALKNIDLVELEKLAMTQASGDELAAAFGMTRRNWLARYANKTQIIETIERGKAKGRISLRREQLMLALKGNPTMLIWLGKQILGQKDLVITEHAGEMTVNSDEVKERLYSRIRDAAAKRAAEAGNISTQ